MRSSSPVVRKAVILCLVSIRETIGEKKFKHLTSTSIGECQLELISIYLKKKKDLLDKYN
jgi:hypothetical protein